jgi:hypothetical protein
MVAAENIQLVILQASTLTPFCLVIDVRKRDRWHFASPAAMPVAGR